MFHVVIPARHAASRLPGKPLLLIEGKPMIQWVWALARNSGAASITIATDDERIRQAAERFGAECVMTSTSHASGTDRIAEVARARQWAAEEVIVNVQGDEPLMPSGVVTAVAGSLSPGVDIATAVAPIANLQEFLDPNCVKALRAGDGRALYFSRAPVPWPRDRVGADGVAAQFSGAWRHIGIYAYRVRSLLEFASLSPTFLEITERLEQLRALEHGMTVHLVALPVAPPAGVDTADDLLRVRTWLAANG